MKLAGIIRESIVDGPGLRFVIFAQGCPHKCFGCHNPQTHDFEGGFFANTESILAEIKKNPLLSGVTFSGGEPFCQAKDFCILANKIKKLGLNVMAYTGYNFEDLMDQGSDENCWREFLNEIDILVDGKFESENTNLTLKFRGSQNQRIIDVPKSILNKKTEIAFE